ncbi:DUF2243 domain-containing protein [Pilimelia anulata]|uniref:DUF2243 domain-containing protein n=1 Tax=Pilimelia anulata TaxID=53371 RepID=UPI001E42DF38|nr:DUF2243 domain-containing protein [Pilimelia anulata]
MTEKTSATGKTSRGSGTPVGAGLLIGVGFGGLVDGVVLHQILQWHHLVSEVDRYPPGTVPGLEANTLADGLFHAVTLVLLGLGLFLLYRRAAAGVPLPRGGRWWGLVLAGWGGFNVVEGVVDHHLLRVHHVRPGPYELAYDLAFLAFGVLLLVGGWLLYRRGGRRTRPARRPGE